MRIFFGIVTALAFAGIIYLLVRKSKRKAVGGGTGSGAGAGRSSGLQ